MRDTILLFESRDLCYESNQFFMERLKEGLEAHGCPVELCDLSVRMEEKLAAILERQESYRAAIDFNSLLPRVELEDGTPSLTAFQVPFFDYLVDHPLYHHAGLKRAFPCYHVICIDLFHQSYIRQYYPQIGKAHYLPLGAMQAPLERSFDQKRLELLFLGTYEPEERLYQELWDYPEEKRKEIASLIERMEADPALRQEEALCQYLNERGECLDAPAFAERLNSDYLSDKYLRNAKRKHAALSAARAGVPFTIVGHGWDAVKQLRQRHVCLRAGVSFAASLQVMANARMLLNTTPGFHGGLHDRVYSAMRNHTLCLTEETEFSRRALTDGENAVLYDETDKDALAEKITFYSEHRERAEAIAKRAYQISCAQDGWEKRAEKILEWIG